MAPNRARKPRALLLLCVIALLGAACGGELRDQAQSGSGGKTKTILSDDGAFTMKVPSSWSQEDNLNDVAVLQAANRSREAYAVLIVDPKKPFDGMELGKFADGQVQKFLESVSGAKTKGPSTVEINGEESVQYEIEGKADDVDVIYLYTFLESPDRFMKAVTWSLADQFESNEAALKQVTRSIRQVKELEGVPEASPSAVTDATGTPSPASPPPPVEDASVVR